MSKTTLYKATRVGKVQQWTIWVEDCGKSGFPEVWIEHGQVTGKKQTTFDVIKEGVNIGKVNETTAMEQAYLTFFRKVVKQREEGYFNTAKEATKKRDIDFDQIFPKQLCFYKPVNSITDEKIVELEKAKRAMYSVKEDGMMFIVRKSKMFGV
jgi:macrodomain Ter protein organizer (MatP/YcbG family)